MAARTAKIFIDGESGTTGLGIRERLAAVTSITVIAIDPAHRKDLAAKRAVYAEADLAVLCLPDDAAREAAALADDLGKDGPKLLDASTAHRVAPGWVYGFAELVKGQDNAIRKASRVANPGCYPTGAIALIRPLVDAGLIPADYPITVNAVSGYSGGGKAMIAACEDGTAPAFELYGLGFDHKHIPELMVNARLTRRPIFIPSVGNFRQGMLVSVPLHLDTLPARPKPADLEQALVKHYAGEPLIRVAPAKEAVKGRLQAEAVNNTDKLELSVFADPSGSQAVLVARLDNLGKGASGAAVENLRLMLGLGLG